MNTDSAAVLPKFPGYQILNQLSKSVHTQVYQAIHIASQQPVVIKALCEDAPSVGVLAQFRNQYEVARNLQHPAFVTSLSLERWGNRYALVMTDEGYLSLPVYGQQTELSVRNVLDIAVQLAEALHYLIGQRIIHKDIKPNNILIHPQTGQIKLIDFSIACLLPKEQQQFIDPKGLEGTLAYMPPEQTGRMNRGIDYRCDFYALGATVYELLTGQLPFPAEDPMALVHAHMTTPPPSAHQLAPGVPPILSEILIKLMAKNAEDRYQSALGLKHDLLQCRDDILEKAPQESFPLGRQDVRARFLIPEKLYGRQQEVKALLETFGRVSQGSVELMLVAGFSGIGKTAVVHELHKPITQQQGYFIQGKFDQFNRNIPFSAFVQAFRHLVGQLLGESDTALQGWKSLILDAVGDRGQVLLEVMPELELIIGPQPEVTNLTGTEAQNRFNLLFGKFVRVFSRTDHPLVIFLDDLQWADAASLNLLTLIMGEMQPGPRVAPEANKRGTNKPKENEPEENEPKETQPLEINNSENRETGTHSTETAKASLLVLGAYRDNEVSAAHPLLLTLEEIEKQGAQPHLMTLKPLGEADVTHLVADTLLCSVAAAAPLSELVYQKTQGNPFFTTQFLQGLHGEGYIRFNADTDHWECDLGQVTQLTLTEDVVGFMVGQLQKLPPDTQTALKLAACIGNRFDLETLAVVCGASQGDVSASLWRSLQAGLVVPENQTYRFFQGSEAQEGIETVEMSTAGAPDSAPPALTTRYRFLHDRVQQAAYALIPAADTQAIHLKIGQRLLQDPAAHSQSETFFAMVGQLNKGADLLTTQAERTHLAQVYLDSVHNGIAATGYRASVDHYALARQLLPPASWHSDYSTTLTIFVESLEAEYLCTNFEAIEPLATIILAHTQQLLDSIRVHAVRIRAWIGQGEQRRALQLGLDVLKLLKVDLLEQPPTTVNNIHALQQAPAMEDPAMLAAMDIMAGIITCAWAVSPEDFRKIAFTMVEVSLRYGNCPASSFGFAWYGTILCEFLGNIEEGYQFGQLAVALLDRFKTQTLRAKVLNIYATCIGGWKHHVRHCLPFHLDGLQSGLETGDLEFASYDAAEYAQYQFLMGLPLPQVQESCEQKLSLIQHLNQDFHIDYLAPWLQGTLNLQTENFQSEGLRPENDRPESGQPENEQPDASSKTAPANAFKALTVLEGSVYQESTCLDAFVEQKQLTLAFVAYFVKSFLSYVLGDYKQALAHGNVARAHNAGVTGSLSVPTEMFYSSLARLAYFEKMDAAAQQQAKEDIHLCLAKLKHWATYAAENFQHKCELIEAELAKRENNPMAAMAHYDNAIAHAREQSFLQEEAIAHELAAKFYLAWGRERVAASYLQDAYDCYRRWGAKAKLAQLAARHPQFLSLQRPTSDAESPLSTLNPLSTLGTPSRTTLRSQSTLSQTHSNTNTALDLITILKASQAISGRIDLDELLTELTKILLQNSGSDRCAIMLCEPKGEMQVRAIASLEDIDLVPVPLNGASRLPIQLIRYVKHTAQPVVLDSPDSDLPVADTYLNHHRPASGLCLPLLDHAQLRGILYLENQKTCGVFHTERLTALNLLATQAAIALENARLYQQSQAYAQQISESQIQLVQNEKMSALGNLVAGVAHEINNPLGFVSGNIKAVSQALEDITECLQAYREAFPAPGEDLEELLEDADIDFLLGDVPKMLTSMELGCQRLRSISNSLRTFSRADTEVKFNANLHEGLESTLLILKYRLKFTDLRPHITIVRDYGELPEITCFPGQLNQVFMNLLANAIDMFDEMAEEHQAKGTQPPPPQITIRTQKIDAQTLEIGVGDNGKGMPEAVCQRIFDRKFTTKAVGKGTGLGLAIAQQIVVETHGGTLTVKSKVGQGTEFIIRLPM